MDVFWHRLWMTTNSDFYESIYFERKSLKSFSMLFVVISVVLASLWKVFIKFRWPVDFFSKVSIISVTYWSYCKYFCNLFWNLLGEQTPEMWEGVFCLFGETKQFSRENMGCTFFRLIHGLIKFIYSEKTTQFCKISTIYLTGNT